LSTNTAAIPVIRATSPGDALHPRARATVVVVLGLLVALGPFTTDLYLPAFPAVQASFRTSDVAIQLTLSSTILGFAVGQLVVGPLSDRYGRRMPLMLATTLHVLTCLGAAVAPNVGVLAALRLLQGVGAAAAGSSRPRWCATCSTDIDSSGRSRTWASCPAPRRSSRP
jgi:MFS transporter, DHA1 family, multidrug resistance protein